MFGWELKILGSKSGQQGTLFVRKYGCDYVLPPLLSTVHMAMNADLLAPDLLAPGSNVFYLRGTTGEFVLATVLGLSFFLECVAISYERSGHTPLYRDCPRDLLTFSISVLPVCTCLRLFSFLGCWLLELSPFIHHRTASLAGGVGCCNHQFPRSLEWSGPFWHANP